MSYQLSGVNITTKSGSEANADVTHTGDALQVTVRDDNGTVTMIVTFEEAGQSLADYAVQVLALTFDNDAIQTIREFCGF